MFLSIVNYEFAAVFFSWGHISIHAKTLDYHWSKCDNLLYAFGYRHHFYGQDTYLSQLFVTLFSSSKKKTERHPNPQLFVRTRCRSFPHGGQIATRTRAREWQRETLPLPFNGNLRKQLHAHAARASFSFFPSICAHARQTRLSLRNVLLKYS